MDAEGLALELLGVPFHHEPISHAMPGSAGSVTFDEFNPQWVCPLPCHLTSSF